MLSPLKIRAALTIAAVSAGVLLPSVGSDPRAVETLSTTASQASGPSALTTEVQPPTEFSGSFTCSTYWQDGSSRNIVLGSVADGNLVRRETRGEVGRFNAEVTDPRLRGTYTVYSATDEYFWPGVDTSEPLLIARGVLHVTNEEGSWQMPWDWLDVPGGRDVERPRDPASDGISLMTGDGGYEGLTAVFTLARRDQGECHCWISKGLTAESERCTWDMHGLVVEGVPPTPVLRE
jgi:hypothetical protein